MENHRLDTSERLLTRKSSRRNQSIFTCTKCKQGKMNPLHQEGEPEYTDIFTCDKCDHTATIPSLVIIFTQFISAIAGGIVSAYLFIQHLSKVLTAFQFNTTDQVSSNLSLMAVAALFLLGFGYTLFRAFLGINRRRKYRINQ